MKDEGNGTAIYGQLQSVTVAASARKEGHVLSSIVDGTRAKQLGVEIQDAREYAENIVETVRKPLVVLDSDLKILTANHSFYETFKVTHEETIGNFISPVISRKVWRPASSAAISPSRSRSTSSWRRSTW